MYTYLYDIKVYILLDDLLFSLNEMSYGSFHISLYSYNSLFLLLHSIHDWMYNHLVNHSLTDGHIGYFQFFSLCVSGHMSKYFYGIEMELFV